MYGPVLGALFAGFREVDCAFKLARQTRRTKLEVPWKEGRRHAPPRIINNLASTAIGSIGTRLADSGYVRSPFRGPLVNVLSICKEEHKCRFVLQQAPA